MQANASAILIIGACLFIPLWIGAKAGEKEIRTTEDFFVQSRNMGLIAVFCTVQVTWWSAFAFLGATAYYYCNGPIYWTTIAWDILFGILFYVIGKRIWFYGKANNYITATDFFEGIYGSKILGIIVTIIMMVFTIPYFQIQVSGCAYLIETVSRGLIPSEMGAFIFTAVIVIYVWTGGLRAVAWADIFYEILIIVGAVLAVIFVIKLNGFKQLFETLKIVSPESLTLSNNGCMQWISMFIIVPTGAIMAPPLWIRMYAVKSPKIFNIMPLLLACSALLNFAPMLAGNTAIILEAELTEVDTVLPILLLNHTPFIIAYFILIGAAAAAMSTSNSQIHSISSIYTIDIHKKYINKDIPDKNLLTIGRCAIVFFAILSYLTKIYLPGTLVHIGMLALSGTAQLIVPTIGALFWKKANARGAIAGLICGIITFVIFTFIKDLNIGIHTGMLALLINGIVYFIVCNLIISENPEISKKIIELKKRYESSF